MFGKRLWPYFMTHALPALFLVGVVAFAASASAAEEGLGDGAVYRTGAVGSGYSVLLVGDSLSIGLGKQLERIFSDVPDVHFARLGKVSSGLARPDFFDWEDRLDKMAAAQRPDVVAVMIGANDNKTLTDGDGRPVYFDSPEWDALYTEKAARLFAICRKYNPDVRLFWIGAPVMKDAVLAGDVRRINAVLADLCAGEKNCSFIDTGTVLADENGRFTMYARAESGDLAPIRVEDGVHVTAAGARIMAEHCLAELAPALGKDGDASFVEPVGLRPVAGGAALAAAPGAGPAPDASGPAQERYTVGKGESLWRIARRRGLDMDRLLAANPGISPDKVAAGRVIILPAPHIRIAGRRGAADIGRAAADAKAAAESMQPATYKVRKGDSFWSIAKRFGVGDDRIAAANRNLDPNSLRPGMVIHVPAPKAGPAPAMAETDPAPAGKRPASDNAEAKTAPATYTVAAGENYWTIAKRLGLQPDALRRANPGVPPKKLRPGQALVLPKKDAAGAEAAESGKADTGPAASYVVAKGDTFWNVAKRFNISVTALKKANAGVNPKRLRPGRVLSIPKRDAASLNGRKTKAGGNTTSENTVINLNQYRIRPGDTFWELSRRFGVDLARLLRANSDADPRNLGIGRCVVVPGASTADGRPAGPGPHIRAVGVPVAPGDTMWDLAGEYGVDVETLLRANSDVDPLRLPVGHILSIPAKPAVADLEPGLRFQSNTF